MNNLDMNHERQLLLSALNSIKTCDNRETQLLHELKELREKRATFDASVQRIMVDCEEARLPNGDFIILLEDIRHAVAVSLTRHSLRGA